MRFWAANEQAAAALGVAAENAAAAAAPLLNWVTLMSRTGHWNHALFFTVVALLLENCWFFFALLFKRNECNFHIFLEFILAQKGNNLLDSLLTTVILARNFRRTQLTQEFHAWLKRKGANFFSFHYSWCQKECSFFLERLEIKQPENCDEFRENVMIYEASSFVRAQEFTFTASSVRDMIFWGKLGCQILQMALKPFEKGVLLFFCSLFTITFWKSIKNSFFDLLVVDPYFPWSWHFSDKEVPKKFEVR